MRQLKVRFDKADGTPWTEWDSPSGMPLDMIHFKENTALNVISCTANDHPELQMFIGNRVLCGIDKNSFLERFKNGSGYEYIEEWKIKRCKSMSLLNGKQILRITEMLREYGHKLT
ncbi:hypothetical protein CCP1ISM_20037 [Azospirillaceae bacterium]